MPFLADATWGVQQIVQKRIVWLVINAYTRLNR